MAPRWRKIFRDLLSNKGRTLLVVLAIAVGIFSFGSVFITQDVLLKNIDIGYKKSNASNIFLYLTDFDSTLIDWVKRQSGVKDAAGVSTNRVKLVLPDGKKEILILTSVPDYSQMDVNLLKPITGSWPPQKGEMLMERNSLSTGKIRIGDTANLEITSDKMRTLLIAGSVYDNAGFPYTFTNQMSGFISWDTLAYLGFPKEYNTLEIVTDASIKTLSDAEKFTFNLTEDLRRRGVEINGSMILKPNQHWATDNSKAFIAILSTVGIFSLVLSGFLVVNTISALLSQQRKQVGIMKAIGAGRSQVVSIYLIMVAFYGILALLVALPIGLILASAYLKMIARFINLDITDFFFPTSVLLMEIGAALLVPVVAAAIPIFQSSKSSIRSAIGDYQDVKKTGKMEHLLAKIGSLPRTTLISLRNVFRKRGRLILTLSTLTVAGALFISVLNVQAGMYKEIDRILAMFDFGVSTSLNGNFSVGGVGGRIMQVANVTAVEGRSYLNAARVKPDGSKGGGFTITGLPPETPFSHPVVLFGRWLKNSDTNQIVLSSSYVKDNPDLSVGDNLAVEVESDKYNFEIVGIIAMSGDQKLGFANFNTVSQINDTPGLASGFMIKVNPNDAKTQDQVANDVEDKLKRAGISMASRETRSQIYSSASAQFNFMVIFLLVMAVMVAIVGGLGLAGTMSLNVLERTREIGIMRSIGAGDAVIRKLVLIEGLFVGFLSWLLAIPLSVPLTYGFCYSIGVAFFSRPLVFTIVANGIIIWLIIIVVISAVASLIPAGRASKMRISETLSYE